METNNSKPFCQEFVTKIKNKINYFGDNTVLHGFGKVFNTSNSILLKRSQFFWFVMVVLSAISAALMLRGVLSLYAKRALSYSVETTYLDWYTPFPAVTVCEAFDTERLKTYMSTSKMSNLFLNFMKDVLFWKFCKTCSTCNMNKTCLEDVVSVVKDFRLDCNSIFRECSYADTKFDCCKRFIPIYSEYGTCYVFNSRALSNDSDIEYLNRKVGLRQLNVTINATVNVRVHSPDDVVSVSSDNILGSYSTLALVNKFLYTVKAEQTISDQSVLLVPANMRGCYMSWEIPGERLYWPFEKYSYSACMWSCRVSKQIELCNCSHHLSPKIDNVRQCDTNGLVCLNKNRDLLSPTCQCPMDCNEVVYKLVHVSTGKRLSSKSGQPSQFVVRFSQLPSLRVKRHAFRDRLSLVVDIGGVGGVCFGASVLSLLEIVYLFCIRRNN